MAFGTEKQVYTGTRTIDQAEFDAGLRAHMLRVYNYMASGLALTGIFAIVIAQLSVVTNDAGQIVALTNLGNTLFGSPFKWVAFTPCASSSKEICTSGKDWLISSS